MADAEEMNPEFARWHREIDFGGDPERLKQRWAGVVKIIDQATQADVETLTRLAFRFKQAPAQAALSRIITALKEGDPTFEPAKGGRETEILAGSALHMMMLAGGASGGVAALAVSTAAIEGGRIPDLPVELVSAADKAIGGIADEIRDRPDLGDHYLNKLPPVTFEEAANKIAEAQNNWGNIGVAFGLAAKATQAAMTGLANRTASILGKVSDYIAVQDEELQMLWWLIGERSWDLDCAFDAVPDDAQPLVFGKELAALTEFPPGPHSVKALLSRAGLKEKKRLTIPVAVNSCPAEWLKRLVEEKEPSPVIHPIHFAIKRKLETGDDRAWVDGWAAVADVASDRALGALALGTLFYRERLLKPFFEA